MTFLDFFAGIGGFRLGMEQAGHICRGFIEIDKFAVRSYKAMHETEGEFYANDIRAIEPNDLPEADCYCGGFPCQAFSIAGKRRGFEDTRGTLIYEVFRLVKAKKPKILFLENVAGLLSHDGGKTFGTILCAMDELGYDAEWQCINSKGYVPQNRDRIFIIGHLRGESERKIFPFGRENKTALKQLIGGRQGERLYDSEGISCTLSSQSGGFASKTGLYLVDITDNPKITNEARCILASYSKNGQRISEFKRSGVLEVRPCLTPDRQEKRQNGRRFKESNEEMFTLTSQDRHGVLFSDGCKKRIRKLTPLECFRLQGFPDELFYKAQAITSDSQLYKQAGNSVTVNVIYEIAKRLM